MHAHPVACTRADICQLLRRSQAGCHSRLNRSRVQVLMCRSMLSVPYFERALYLLPEEEVTAERILALADETEV